VVIRGTVRCFDPAVQDRVEHALRSMSTSLAAANGATASVEYMRRYPPTVNSHAEVDSAIAAARATAGGKGVRVGVRPSMASEDFAFMLQARPGAYIWLGADSDEPGAALHNPHYDFNDGTLMVGASYWISLVQKLLGER
jgi:hippurate hydrolase